MKTSPASPTSAYPPRTHPDPRRDPHPAIHRARLSREQPTVTRQRCAIAQNPRRDPTTKPCGRLSAQPPRAPPPRSRRNSQETNTPSTPESSRTGQAARRSRAGAGRGPAVQIFRLRVRGDPHRAHTARARMAKSPAHAPPTYKAASLARVPSSSHTRAPHGMHETRGTAQTGVERWSGVNKRRV